jgi:hypothetical protein
VGFKNSSKWLFLEIIYKASPLYKKETPGSKHSAFNNIYSKGKFLFIKLFSLSHRVKIQSTNIVIKIIITTIIV